MPVHPHHHDPYAPHNPRAVPAPQGVLPVARMRRLGATQRTTDAIEAWWQALSADERAVMADQWGVMADPDLADALAGIDGVFDAGVNTTLTWVRRQPFPVLAARLALTIEPRRDGPPRPSAVTKLADLAAAT